MQSNDGVALPTQGEQNSMVIAHYCTKEGRLRSALEPPCS